jgi:hypothetical protein
MGFGIDPEAGTLHAPNLSKIRVAQNHVTFIKEFDYAFRTG